MFEEDLLGGGGEGGEAGGVGFVGGEAHEAVEDGPGWAEDLGRWAVGGLFEGEVGFLCFFCWDGVRFCRGEGGMGLRRTEKPTAVPRAMGRRIEAAGLEKIIAGRVMEGM